MLPKQKNSSLWREREAWSAGISEAIEAGSSYERREPIRIGDLRSDFILPLAQAVGCSIAAGILAAILWGSAGAALRSAGVVFSLAWFLLLIDNRSGLWIVERITGRDLDRDGSIGRPARPVRVEVVDREGRSMRWPAMPLGEEKLRDLARAIVVTRSPYSRRALCRDRQVLTQNEYENLSRALLEAGLLRDLPGNNRELTPAGRAMMRQLLEEE